MNHRAEIIITWSFTAWIMGLKSQSLGIISVINDLIKESIHKSRTIYNYVHKNKDHEKMNKTMYMHETHNAK